jgi:hypothetical protein
VLDGILVMVEVRWEKQLMNSMKGGDGEDKKGHFSKVKYLVF